jgi:hypothetical protein
MQVASRRFDILVAHQNLDGSQVCSVFQHVSGKTVPEGILVLLMICTQKRSGIAITRGTEQRSS